MLYILCIVAVSIFSLFADKKNKQLFVFLCAFVLSFLCGMRGIGTGVDTIHYYNFMSYIRGSGVSFGSDIGFSIISYFLMGIFNNPYYPLIVFSFVTNFLIVYRLWDFREEADFTLMLFIYMVVYYSYTFNIVRQFFAISIIFWGTRYIERGEYIKYIILNILATTIHTSSLICFSFLFVTFGFKTKKKKFKFLGFGMAVLLVAIGMKIFNDNIVKYEGYFLTADTTIHAMTILKIFCLLLVIFSNKVFRNNAFSVSSKGEIIPMQRQIPIMYAAGLALATMGMGFTFMNRIGFYFIIYEIPFWGQTVRARTNREIYRVMIFLILAYVLISNLLSKESADNLFYYNSFLTN